MYCKSVSFRGFENLLEKPPDEMSSFSESEAVRLIKDSGTSIWNQLSKEVRLTETFFLIMFFFFKCIYVLFSEAASVVNTISPWCIVACG